MTLLRQIAACVALLLAGASAIGDEARHAAPGYTESEIKAAFIINLFAFIDWPQGTSVDTLCVTQADATASAIESLLKARPELGLKLKNLASVSDVSLTEVNAASAAESTIQDDEAGCDVVFISKQTALDPAALPGTDNVLTISDAPGFARSGGMVELERRTSRVGLVLNHQVMLREGFSVSSRLLSLARVVATGGINGN